VTYNALYSFERVVLKKCLTDLENTVRWEYGMHKIDERTTERGHTVPQLSPHQC
jgi:hypothetical protein